MSVNQNIEIPPPFDFFLKVPIYTTFLVNSDNWQKVKEILTFEGYLDVYCIKSQIVRPFYRINKQTGLLGKEGILSNQTYNISFCSIVDENSVLEFYIMIRDNKLQKVGQYPSIADIEIVQIKKYNKLLKSQSKELSKAIGLNAHGVGIGSFVYLRRIFENLIEEAHQEAMKLDSWDEDKYKQLRMQEKIDTLKEILPSLLVENKSIYGILSKGIHELDEEECLKFFDVLKLGIEFILDEKLAKIEKEIKITNYRKSINQIKNHIEQN